VDVFDIRNQLSQQVLGMALNQETGKIHLLRLHRRILEQRAPDEQTILQRERIVYLLMPLVQAEETVKVLQRLPTYIGR